MWAACNPGHLVDRTGRASHGFVDFVWTVENLHRLLHMRKGNMVITTFVMINSAKNAVSGLAETLCDIEGVTEVYSVTGEFDLIAIVRVTELDQVADVITGEIAKLPGVLRTQTHVAFKAFSRLDLEAMFSIGAE